MQRTVTAFLGVLILAISAHAAVLSVQPDRLGEYPTIQEAINASQRGDIVKLADGIYSGHGNVDINFYGRAIELRSASDNAEACIIDVQGIHGNWIVERAMVFDHEEGNDSIVRGLTIMNGDADGPCPDCQGGAVQIISSSPVFHNVVFRNNFGFTGGAVFVDGQFDPIPAPKFFDCAFIDNVANTGAGVELLTAKALFKDCVFTGNVIPDDGVAAAVRVFYNSTMIMEGCTVAYNSANYGSAFEVYDSLVAIRNSIIAFNHGTTSAIYVTTESPIHISYTTIAGNDGNNWPKDISHQLGRNGNMNVVPIFEQSLIPGEIRLSENSPCIDAGHPDSPLDPDGTRRDMGAYFYDQTDLIELGESSFNQAANHSSQAFDIESLDLPDAFEIQAIYPNPFNTATTISISLPIADQVSMVVLDVLGRQVVELQNGTLAAGNHEFSLDASRLTSGIYFVIAESTIFGRQVQKAMLTK
jgi:Secretion system C-terminal sorting domain